MRKCLLLLLILALLCPGSAEAAEAPGYLALVFTGCPADSAPLLAALESRKIPATFFLRQEDTDAVPLLSQFRQELGIIMDYTPDQTRRQAAALLQSIENEITSPAKLLYTPSGRTDGLRQVAKALGFTFITPAGPLLAPSMPEDGDILLADARTGQARLLSRLDTLTAQGFVFLTVSQLARLRNTPLRPGSDHRSFPPHEQAL